MKGYQTIVSRNYCLSTARAILARVTIQSLSSRSVLEFELSHDLIPPRYAIYGFISITVGAPLYPFQRDTFVRSVHMLPQVIPTPKEMVTVMPWRGWILWNV
jgi:hypothetical protein